MHDYDVSKLRSREMRQILRQEQTKAEALLWNELRKLRKQHGIVFRRQHSFDCFIVDFYCPSKKLVIEIDGSVHDIEDIKQQDIARQQFIENYGVQFLRFKNKEIYNNIQYVVRQIINKCL